MKKMSKIPLFLLFCWIPFLFSEEAKSPQESQLELERPTLWGEPTEVEVAIYLIDIDEINSAEQSFAASVYYIARWKSPYLAHKGPGPLQRKVTEVWTPNLTIVNEQMAWKSFPEYVQIDPDGTVIYRQKVWGNFSQPLKLQEFPLDKQRLAIHIVAPGLLEHEARLVDFSEVDQKRAGMSHHFSLPDFNVLSWHVKSQPYYSSDEMQGTAGYIM